MAVMIDRTKVADQRILMVKAILACPSDIEKPVWKTFKAPTTWLRNIPPTTTQLEVKAALKHNGKVPQIWVTLHAKDTHGQPTSTEVGQIAP
jgi:hypothetical protein